MLRKNRVFFKDYDGSLIEVPQKKVFVKTKELRKLMKAADDGGTDGPLARRYGEADTTSAVIANAYGAFAGTPLRDLCENTRRFHKQHAPGGGSSQASPRSQMKGHDFDAEQEPGQEESGEWKRRATMAAAATPFGGPTPDPLDFPPAADRAARHRSLKQKASQHLADLGGATPQIDEANESPFQGSSQPSQADEQDDEESQRFLQ